MFIKVLIDIADDLLDYIYSLYMFAREKLSICHNI